MAESNQVMHGNFLSGIQTAANIQNPLRYLPSAIKDFIKSYNTVLYLLIDMPRMIEIYDITTFTKFMWSKT